jgi:hypothetical protein
MAGEVIYVENPMNIANQQKNIPVANLIVIKVIGFPMDCEMHGIINNTPDETRIDIIPIQADEVEAIEKATFCKTAYFWVEMFASILLCLSIPTGMITFFVWLYSPHLFGNDDF